MKHKKIVKLLSFILVSIFFTIYYSYITGNYKTKEYNKMILTKEAMIKFEEDINNGKDISIDDYIVPSKDYSSKVSNLGVKVSESISKLFTKGSSYIFKTLSKLVTN